MINIIPNHKSDFTTCENLLVASDSEVIDNIDELLCWLQDINWPVYPLVKQRLLKIGIEIVDPIKRILQSDDGGWKYWIVSDFLHSFNKELMMLLYTDLKKLAEHPTDDDICEEVNIVAKELIEQL